MEVTGIRHTVVSSLLTVPPPVGRTYYEG